MEMHETKVWQKMVKDIPMTPPILLFHLHVIIGWIIINDEMIFITIMYIHNAKHPMKINV